MNLPTTAGKPVFPGNCTGNLNSLANSPTFAMSLGAKELFHTNFLAFLLESQDPLVEPIQQKLKKLFFGHDKVGRVITWREKESLDLVIMPAPKLSSAGDAELDYSGEGKECEPPVKTCTDYGNTIAVVIEAKFKSIPTQPQLDEYDEKLINGIDFELDDVDTVDVSFGVDTRTWQVMKLKLAADGNVEKCNSECTIDARGKKKEGEGAKGNIGEIRKFKGTVRRLLLRPLSANECNAPMGCWEQMSWQCVVDALKCDRHEAPCEATSETTQLFKCKETVMLPRIICDYRDSLAQLLSILDQTYDYVKLSVAKPPTTTYGVYYQAIIDSQFKRRRIHDLVGKYASHILERVIMDFVCGALANTDGNGQNCEDCSSASSQSSHIPPFKVCDLPFELYSYTHFSNQQPGIGFEWLVKQKVGKERKERRISFGVQIQGKEYRHFICVEGGEKTERVDVLDVLEKLLGNWFFEEINSVKLEIISKEKRKFYVFDESKFRYSKTNISALPLSELAQVVCRSLCLARGIVGEPQSNDLCTKIGIFFAKKNGL